MTKAAHHLQSQSELNVAGIHDNQVQYTLLRIRPFLATQIALGDLSEGIDQGLDLITVRLPARVSYLAGIPEVSLHLQAYVAMQHHCRIAISLSPTVHF